MATLPTTLIGTSDPVNLCEGFALFPEAAPIRAGVATSNKSNTLINENPTILVWSLTATGGYEFFFGVCGPSYAIKFNLSGETSGDQNITLDVEDDEAQAGFFVGCTLTPTATLNVSEESITWVSDGWHSHFATSWSNAFSTNVEIEIDLLELLIDAILALTGGDNPPPDANGHKTFFQQVEQSVVPSAKGYGLFDSKEDTFAANGGEIDLRPQITLPINIVPLIEPLEAISKGLEALSGELSAGPSLGLAVPTTINLTQVNFDDTVYGNFTYDSTNDVLNGSTNGANPDDVETVTVTLQHTPGLDLTVGFYFDVGVLKIFSFSGSWDTGVLEDLGLTIAFGPYDNTLTNTAGSTTLGGSGRFSQTPGETIRVIFEPAGAPA